MGIVPVYWCDAPGQICSGVWDKIISASVTRLVRSLMTMVFNDSSDKGLSHHHLLAPEMSSECETVLSEMHI